MKRWLALLLVALFATSFASAGIAAQDDTATTVMVAETEELGQFLTDSEGRTLYLFTNDTEPGVSTCGGECLVN
jgi:predicted lipoprotein with Yx(FWY)xxD motif